MKGPKIIVGQADPPVIWDRPWDYAEWKAAVLQGRYAGEQLLAQLYLQRWEPAECHQHMLFRNLFKKAPKPPKSRKVILDVKFVERRLAEAYWKECNRLLLRTLEGEARELVEKRKAMAEDGMVQFRT